MEGNIQFASNEHGIGGKLDANFKDLTAANQEAATQTAASATGATPVAGTTVRWVEVWREPTVAVNGKLSLANDFNAVSLQQVTVDSRSLKLTTSGAIADLANSMVTDLTGTWNPDWNELNALLTSYSYNTVQLNGQGQREFAIKGPIFESPQPSEVQPWISPNLVVNTNVGWDQGKILELPVGQSQVNLNVRESIAYLETSGIPFAGGVVAFAPQVDMRSEEPIARLEKARIINNVELRPETARKWLRYVAPLVADATSAEGKFTVDVGDATVPVFNPERMEINGAVHLADVIVGAGPTAEKIIGTVKQIRSMIKPDAGDRDLRTWLKMEQQSVPVAVKEGRVYHNKLKFSHKDLVVQTRGSVGFDQSLSMIAEIKIHDDWIKGKTYLESLRGKSISIPIGGTITNPVVNRDALRQLSQSLLQQTASNALNRAVGDKINPKIDDFRNEIGGKLTNELDKLREKLGGNGASTPTEQTGNNGLDSGLDKLENRLQDELRKGIGNLFKKKNNGSQDPSKICEIQLCGTKSDFRPARAKLRDFIGANHDSRIGRQHYPGTGDFDDVHVWNFVVGSGHD